MNVPRLLGYLNTIKDLDTKETVLKPLLDQNSKPDILIPINDQSLNTKNKSFSFFKIAHAASTIDEEVYKSFGYSLIFEIVNLKESLDDVDQDYDFKSTYNDVIAQSFVNIITNTDANKIRKNYQNQINHQLRNQLYRQPDSMRSDTERIKVVNHFKTLASKTYDRQKIIDNITKAQSLGSFVVMMNRDDKFNTITNALEAFINNNESVDYNALKTLNNTVKEKLVKLLGDQQELFVEKLLSVEAEKIAGFFLNWQAENKNLSNITITDKDLVSFINTLGMETNKSNNQSTLNDYSGIYAIELSITESSFIEQEYRPDPIVPNYTIDDWNESVLNEIDKWDPETSQQVNLKEHQSTVEIQHNKDQNLLSFHFYSDLTIFFSSHNGFRQYESSLENNQWKIQSKGGAREEHETKMVLTFELNEDGIPSFTGQLDDYKALHYTYFKSSYNIKGIKIENLENKK